MKVFIIPSWYPSEGLPTAGIFFREQARLLARYRSGWQVGISTWGSHDPRLWIRWYRPLDAWLKRYSKMPFKPHEHMLEENCTEFLHPAHTWTRRVAKGNIHGIIAANEANLSRFMQHYGRPDVIHAHVAYPAGAIAAALSQKYRVPWVLTEHMSPFPMPSFRKEIHSLLVPIMTSAAAVLALNPHQQRVLGAYGLDAKQAWNFIDEKLFHPGVNVLSNQLVAVGRLEEQKNYRLMLDALVTAVRARPSLQLTVLGDGSQRRSLIAYAERLGIQGHVHWLGDQDQPNVARCLQQSSILLNTSLHENQPVAILEALACGLQVITTDWRGSEVLDRLCWRVGYDAEELADAMLQVLHSTPDPQVIRQRYMGAMGAHLAMDGLEEVYRSVQ